MVDFSKYVTPSPPNSDGLSMFTDVLKSIAERKQQMEIAKMQDAERRAAEQMQATGRANALHEAGRHNLAGETHNAGVLGETGRHNLATEGNAAASLTQQKAMALSKLLAMPGTQQALQATDSGPMDALAPALAPLGAQVQRPGEPGPDDVLPDSGAPESQRRDVVGPDGPMMSFDPATNAVTRARRAMEARDQAERASQGMNKYDAAGMRAGGGAAAALAEAGADPLKALEGGQKYATSSSAQATSRTNAAQMAASKSAAATVNEPYRKNQAVESFVRSVETQNGLPDIRKKAAEASQMRQRLQDPTGIGDTVSMAMLGKSLFGAAQSNAEGKRLLNAGGLETRLKNAFQQMDNGQFSPAFRKDLEALAQQQEMAARTRIAKAGLAAQKLARQHGIIGKIKGADDYVRGRITGQIGGENVDFGGASPRGGTRSARIGGEPAAEGGDALLEDLLQQE